MGKSAVVRIRESAGINECGQAVERLSRELGCLIDLGVLSAEEEAAFSRVLDELEVLLLEERHRTGAADACPPALLRMAGLLASDLDIAYQRLGFAA